MHIVNRIEAIAYTHEIPHQWIQNGSSQTEANDVMNTSLPKHLCKISVVSFWHHNHNMRNQFQASFCNPCIHDILQKPLS